MAIQAWPRKSCSKPQDIVVLHRGLTEGLRLQTLAGTGFHWRGATHAGEEGRHCARPMSPSKLEAC